MRIAWLAILLLISLLYFGCKKDNPEHYSPKSTNQDSIQHIQDSLYQLHVQDSLYKIHADSVAYQWSRRDSIFLKSISHLIDTLVGKYVVSGNSYHWSVYSSGTSILPPDTITVVRVNDTTIVVKEWYNTGVTVRYNRYMSGDFHYFDGTPGWIYTFGDISACISCTITSVRFSNSNLEEIQLYTRNAGRGGGGATSLSGYKLH